MLVKLTYKQAKEFLLPKHYSGRTPSISYAFGWIEQGSLVAVVTYGKPASNALCVGVCGKDYSPNVIELNRVCTTGYMKAQLSQFIATTLKELKQHNLIVVSYADSAMNHHGYIYQACNFVYTGATKRRTDKYAGVGKHSRHYDKDATEQYRQVRSSKHRYVFFTGDKRFTKKARQNLKYPVSCFPKGDNSQYNLGDVLQPEVYKVENNQ